MALDTGSGAQSLSGQNMATAQGITVSNATELQSALATAAPGATILIEGGNYGFLSLAPAWQFNFTGDVTLAAADPNNPPVFDSIYMRGVSNITLQNLEVQMVATQSSVQWDSAILMENTNNITIDNVNLIGADAIAGIPENSVPGTAYHPSNNVVGQPFGNGITVNNGTNITISNSEITHFNGGISMSQVDGIDILGNNIHHNRHSPIFGGDVSNILIDSNHLSSPVPWNYGAGDHGDYIHLWTDPRYQSGPSKNITITNNFLEQADGDPYLGIYLDDDGHNIGHQNVTVSDNVIVSSHHLGGVVFENVSNSQITDNTILYSGDPTGGAPGIYLIDGTSYVSVNNNITSSIVTTDPVSGNAGPGNSIHNNLIVQRDFPDKANYYDDLFVNALSQHPDVADLIALPGSIVAQNGYGSALTQLDTTPAQPTAYIADVHGNGLSQLAHQLDVSNIYGPNGPISTNGATVSWDYGDGSIGSGVVSSHSYSQSGFYDVTATITLADGSNLVVAKTVEVVSPASIALDFESGATDAGGVSNPFSINGNVQFANDGGSMAAKLNGGSISYQSAPDFFDNDEFTVLVDYRKSSLNDTGVLLGFSGSFNLRVNQSSIQASVTTSNGTVWTHPGGLPVDDTAWHQIALTFSNSKGTVDLYLDGNKISTISGLSGAIQSGNIHHDFYVGSPYNDALNGYVDNVAYLSGAMTEQDVQNLHSGSTSLSGIIGSYSNNPNFSLSSPAPQAPTTPTAPIDTGNQQPTPQPNPDTVVVPADPAPTPTPTPTPDPTPTPTPDPDPTPTPTPDPDPTPTTPTPDPTPSTPVDTGNQQPATPVVVSDTVIDDPNDVITIGGSIPQNQINVNVPAGFISVDTNGDGVGEQQIQLQGNFSSGEFMSATSSAGTLVSFQKHLTGLVEGQSLNSNQINGISNAAYLNGDNATSFTIDVQQNIGYAGYQNSLGVYEYDSAGNISDVRIVAMDVKSLTGPISVTGVDAGKGLGFFIVQNGYNTVTPSALSSNNLSINTNGGVAQLMDGSNALNATVFVSHDASLNPGGFEQLVSGSIPNGEGLLIGFEDLARSAGSDNDFEDVVFTVVADAMDFG